MNKFLNSIKNDMTPLNLTANGGVQYATTLNANLDWFGLGSSLRFQEEETMINLINKAFLEDKQLAFRNLFYTRDIRQGQGERKIFRTCLRFLANEYPEETLHVLKHIPEYGRYDDFKVLINTKLDSHMLELIKKQFNEDRNSEEPSLLGKWLPSRPRRKNSLNWGWYNRVRSVLNMTQEEYRKQLVIIRKKLDIVERKITSNQWNEIEFAKLPSQALKRYSPLFMKHCQEQFLKYLESVEKGEVKINTNTLAPYQIVHDILYNKENINLKALDVLWNHLPSFEDHSQTLCIVDTSGSMFTYTNPSAIDVSISLGIYFAERIKGHFQNYMISFNSEPRLVKLLGRTIVEKVNHVNKQCMGYNTNIEKVFDLILDAAIKHHLNKDDMPERLLLISDMQFDAATNSNTKSPLFDQIRTKFKHHGLELPEIVYWNVNASRVGFPEIDGNIKLVSGFNPNIYKMMMGAEPEMSPELFMLNVLNSKRYADIIIN